MGDDGAWGNVIDVCLLENGRRVGRVASPGNYHVYPLLKDLRDSSRSFIFKGYVDDRNAVDWSCVYGGLKNHPIIICLTIEIHVSNDMCLDDHVQKQASAIAIAKRDSSTVAFKSHRLESSESESESDEGE